ncbi:MAG: hypothetical protein ABJK64_04610 [Paraglaciecola sp.]|uniref:hypothetical protein n=1 Tax=Paraglaciecola sp. TaxID=1920173 RepID=UPI003299594C
MKNDNFSIISRFHVSSMSCCLFLILSMSTAIFYSMLVNQTQINIQTWMLVTLSICTSWLFFNVKDWKAYYKLYKNQNHLINDERFQNHSNKAAKLGFITLMISNLSMLIIDLFVFSLGVGFTSLFSLVSGLSAFLIAHIILELRE